MSSDIEKLAAALHALADDSSGLAHGLTESRARVKSLVQQVSQLRVEGVDIRPVVDALLRAETRTQQAIERLRDLRTQGHDFANRLVTGGGGASAAVQPAASDLSNDPANAALGARLDELGLRLAPVDSFDFSDNPILGWNKGATAEDTRWAVERWNDTIAPGIATGATRSDFEDYDNRSGAAPMRKLAMVWDVFLGSDPIKPDASGPGGKSGLVGGRHRIAMARLAGVRFLPVRK
jgi:hypothetical protein